MQSRWVAAIFTAVLLALLVPATVTAGVDPDGYGHVFPAPDPADPVDVPAPSPAGVGHDLRARAFPAEAVPQPTFAPINGTHVYVAALDSTLAPPNATLFVCDGAGDEGEINDAIAAAQGGIVELLDGTFRCSGRITLAANTTLRGQGSAKTTVEIVAKPGCSGYLPVAIGAPYVNVEGFCLRGNGFVMVTRSHVRVRDIRATSVDLGGTWRPASGNGMFFVWAAPPVDSVDDVEFYRCEAFNAHTHGFNMNQDYNDRVERAITNVRLLECRATGCGYGVYGDPGIAAPVTQANQSRSEWITGFDLHEWQDLVNCEVVNCVADNNWESGFHLEPGARYGDNGENIGPRTVSQNIVFRNCVSANNGQRNTYSDHFFMSGYYLSRDTHLEDCVSFNNRNCGYYVHGGANSSFTGCTDDGSTYGWKVCKASSGITIADCTSKNNSRWALWLAFSRQIGVTGFRHEGVAGERGYQSILGWYKDETAYQLPVTDSFFEITAVGNGMPIINQAGSGNTYLLTREGTTSGVPVTAGFAASPPSGAAPLAVRFEDRSAGASLWWWDFGDGSSSHERSPVHTYAAPGIYSVTQMAADELSHDTETRPGCVVVAGPVKASLAANPTSGQAPLTVAFTDTSDGSPSSWHWDFGDGETSIERNPVHTYAAPGTYSVTLSVGNAYFTDTVTASNAVTATGPQPTVPSPFVAPVPEGVGPPGDLDGDGRCEDVNGNGRADFADTVLLFSRMDWIAANEPLAAFDYNANGRIDFADVVWLFGTR
jgi:PKD repeat protein